jgi:tRNA pseudouridine55 synthase
MTHNGILLIDKPSGMTSHDVVARVRRIAHLRQVGHTGTLDPMATGLMVVCVGPATRVAQFLTGLDKVYAGTMRLGAISSTYDAEGKITEQDRPLPEGIEPIREAMAAQLGRRIQLPPPYSAVKVQGRKLYEYARAGEPVPQKPRVVQITRFEMMRLDPPDVQFVARVGSGTYIRSMAHDLGIALGCGAYLSQLRRLSVGGFSIDHALPLETLLAEPDLLAWRMMSVTEALGHLPKVTLQPRAELRLLNGGPFTTEDILEFDGILNLGQPVLVIDQGGRALSIARPEALRTGENEDEDAEIAPVLGAMALIFRPMRVLAQPQAAE